MFYILWKICLFNLLVCPVMVSVLYCNSVEFDECRCNIPTKMSATKFYTLICSTPKVKVLLYVSLL